VRTASGNRLTRPEAAALVEKYGKERTLRVLEALDAHPPAGGTKTLAGLLKYRLEAGEGEPSAEDAYLGQKYGPRSQHPNCPECDGTAHVINEKGEGERCPECKGTGHA